MKEMRDTDNMILRCRRAVRFAGLMVAMAVAVAAQGQVGTTMGTDFWVGFMPNNRQAVSRTNPQTLSLLVTGTAAATGTVSCGADSFTFAILPDSMTRVVIPTRNNYFDWTAHGLHVTTSQPVSLYASNHVNYSHDITGVLPTPTLGNDYVLQSYQFHGSGGVDNEFCVIATQNNTTVYYQLGDTGTTVHTALLQSGEALQWQDNMDLSGTHVWTDDCAKPIAVFTGHECAYVPRNQASGDHICEQSVPTSCWGRRFVVTSSLGRVHDLLCVTALHDNTTFAFGGSTYTLQARETAEIDILSDSMPAAYMESDKPVSVFLYLTGWQSGSHVAQMGDPSMLAVHPVEQQLRQVAFSTFVSAYSTYHYANITAESASAGSIALDGIAIDTAFHPVPGHPELAYARIPVSAGSHTLTSSAGGFNAHLYGIGHAESYSYALGAALDPANPLAWLNGTPSMQIDSTNNRFCPGDTLHFRAMAVNEDSTQIAWDLGNGQTASGTGADAVYTVPGDYTIAAVFTTAAGCLGIRQDTLLLPIRIQPLRNVVCDTAVCGDSCLWRGTSYTAAGSYSQYDVGDTADCRLTTLNLTFIAAPAAAINDSFACDSRRMHLAARGTGDSYRWSSTPDDPALAGHEADPSISTEAAGERLYTLRMYYSYDTLCATTATYLKPDIPPLAARAVADPASLDAEHTQITLADLSSGAAGRCWYVDGAAWSTDSVTLLAYDLGRDSMAVLLVAEDSYGCRDTDIVVLHGCCEELWIPNTFTPDARTNSRFMARGTNIQDYEIWIFNRWGVLAWHSTDINEGWDGTRRGKPCAPQAFVYTLRYTTRSAPGCQMRRTGTVTLLR